MNTEHYFVVVGEVDERGDVHFRLVQHVTPPSNGKVVFDNDKGAWISPATTVEIFDNDQLLHRELMYALKCGEFFPQSTTPEPF